MVFLCMFFCDQTMWLSSTKGKTIKNKHGFSDSSNKALGFRHTVRITNSWGSSQQKVWFWIRRKTWMSKSEIGISPTNIWTEVKKHWVWSNKTVDGTHKSWSAPGLNSSASLVPRLCGQQANQNRTCWTPGGHQDLACGFHWFHGNEAVGNLCGIPSC